MVNLGFVLNVIEDPAERVEALIDAWQHTRRALLVSTLIAGQEAYDDVLTFGDGVLTSRDTFQKFFEPAEIQALLEDTLHTEAVPVGLGIYLVFRDTAELHDFLVSRARRFIDWESLSRRLGILKALRAKRDPYDTHRELLTRIKIDLKRLFVTVIDHTNGREHQLLFFKERFLAKDHPERARMDRFSAKLRKLGLREETIGYGTTKEKWKAWNREHH